VQSIDAKLKKRIFGRGKGSIFTPTDFLDLGSRDAIDKALSRSAAKGTFRRLARGLYDYPKSHPDLGMISPDPDTIARAIAGRDNTRIQPSGAYAANLLGLSTQVPAKIVYLTDGQTTTVRLGKQQIQLRHTTAKNMATAGRISGLVIQAFKHIGKNNIDDGRINWLKSKLPKKDKKQLLKDIRWAPAWMHPFFRQIGND